MEWVLPALFVFSVAAVGLAAYALHLAIQSRIDVKALQNSTHNIHMVPMDLPGDGTDKMLNDAMEKADDRLFDDIDRIHDKFDSLM